MDAIAQAFVELLVEYEVIRFGDFKLKSGRSSPYFVNAGQLRSGDAIRRLGEAFAATIRKHALRCDLVFGPSYKGVPLAVATAMQLSDETRDVGFGFDRKEAKEHGEGGIFVGTAPKDGMHVVIVDDVITSGRSIRQAVHQVRASARVHIAGVIVAVDREEQGRGERTTLVELRDELAVDVYPLVTIRSLVDHLKDHPLGAKAGLHSDRIAAIEAYLREYGGSP